MDFAIKIIPDKRSRDLEITHDIEDDVGEIGEWTVTDSTDDEFIELLGDELLVGGEEEDYAGRTHTSPPQSHFVDELELLVQVLHYTLYVVLLIVSVSHLVSLTVPCPYTFIYYNYPEKSNDKTTMLFYNITSNTSNTFSLFPQFPWQNITAKYCSSCFIFGYQIEHERFSFLLFFTKKSYLSYIFSFIKNSFGPNSSSE